MLRCPSSRRQSAKPEASFTPHARPELAGDSAAMARVAARQDAMTGTAGMRVIDAAQPGTAVVRADVAHDSVDDVLDELERLAVPASDVSLARVELVGRLAGRRADTRFAWADVLGVAGTNARVVGQYLVFMAVAGVIGCYGVIDRNPLLLVGAMAVSPDLLPITAIAVGVIGRDRRLALRGVPDACRGARCRGLVRRRAYAASGPARSRARGLQHP